MLQSRLCFCIILTHRERENERASKQAGSRLRKHCHSSLAGISLRDQRCLCVPVSNIKATASQACCAAARALTRACSPSEPSAIPAHWVYANKIQNSKNTSSPFCRNCLLHSPDSWPHFSCSCLWSSSHCCGRCSPPIFSSVYFWMNLQQWHWVFVKKIPLNLAKMNIIVIQTMPLELLWLQQHCQYSMLTAVLGMTVFQFPFVISAHYKWFHPRPSPESSWA